MFQIVGLKLLGLLYDIHHQLGFYCPVPHNSGEKGKISQYFLVPLIRVTEVIHGHYLGSA